MNKWDYIRLISQGGDKYGNTGGVCDLLEWCGKYGTSSVTEEEAKLFFEMTLILKKEKGFSNVRETLLANR